ncbi:MAG: putative substrate-binding transporter protein component [Pseudonocardiales bacterium]|nr:putative substrate-binding transporter protein component [Pseudonocardiales bacterium]
MTRFRPVFAAVTIGASLMLALASCSSSSSTEGSKPVGASGSGAGTGGSSIAAKIMVAGDFTSSIPYTVPEVVPTVKGVLRGFPNVNIETCDTKGTAAAALVCSQKAVTDNVAAVIYGYGYLTQDQTILAKAGIPIIGASDSTSANSFAVSSSHAEFTGIGIGLANAGCKKMGTIYYDGAAALADQIKNGIEAKGGVEVARAAVALNAADVTPAISKLTGAGATCVAVSLAPTAAAQVLTALKQSGKSLLIGSVSAVFSQQVINSLGASLTDGLLVVDSQLNPDDSSPGLAKVKADLATQGSSPVTSSAISAWVAARLVAAALPKVTGAVTASSLSTALNALRDVDMEGVVHSWSSVEVNVSAYKRLFNHYGITYTVKDLHVKPSGTFFDLAGSSALQ